MMKSILLCFSICLIPVLLLSQQAEDSLASRITSTIDSTNVDNMVLTQTFVVHAPVHEVWKAYTTKEGWESWAVAVAEVDFKLGGVIKTNYDANAKIGDEGTITLHIVNFVPMKMLTIQAELTENFKAFTKEEAEHMYNTVLFEEHGSHATKVTSYGIGYKVNEKFRSLMSFFIQGNEWSYNNLIKYLETKKEE